MDRAQSIRIETGARLHFGLLDTEAPFGGLGAMVDQPQTTVQFDPADAFAIDDALRSRGLPIVRRLCRYLNTDTPPNVRVRCLQAAPPHCGYGSGTQLSLAIAEGLCLAFGEQLPPSVLASQIAQRGKRSAVGIHGYFQGGLIFEQNRSGPSPDDDATINPIESRIELPSHWRIVLVRPRSASPAVSGDREANEFSKLRSDCRCRQELTSLVRQGILPAVRRCDFEAFADSLQRYNRASGMLFAPVQGGPYNGPEVTDLIATLADCGGVGVGQSSWGPGVFAWCEDDSAAEQLVAQLAPKRATSLIARPLAIGRRICRVPE